MLQTERTQGQARAEAFEADSECSSTADWQMAGSFEVGPFAVARVDARDGQFPAPAQAERAASGPSTRAAVPMARSDITHPPAKTRSGKERPGQQHGRRWSFVGAARRAGFQAVELGLVDWGRQRMKQQQFPARVCRVSRWVPALPQMSWVLVSGSWRQGWTQVVMPMSC